MGESKQHLSDETVATQRTTVLLGAGASRDAGLPLTEDLARQLVESFDEELRSMGRHGRDQEPVVRALHLIYGAMVAHATEQGSSPLTAVNVERLVSAVRLLRDRRIHEAAPFIASWRGSIEDVDDHPLPLRDRDLHIGFDRDLRLNTAGLARDIAAIAKATASPGDGDTFRRLEDQLLRRICQLLSEPTSVAYLHPLIQFAVAQPGGLDVTTLNYDRTIELAAAELAVPVDTGLQRWQPGSPLDFEMVDGQINLIKPHGSVDWVRETGNRSHAIPGHPLALHRYRIRTSTTDGPRSPTVSPLIVIGDREKLETDGPTLQLMRAFEQALSRATNLVVVGYSFSDEHINTVIRHWLVGDEARTISILDPGWPRPERQMIGPDTKLSLRDALRYDAGISPTAGASRVIVTRMGAGAGLLEALTARPMRQVTPEITIVACLDSQPYIRITNRGYDLEALRVTVFRRPGHSVGGSTASIESLRLTAEGEGRHEILIDRLAVCASIDIYFDRTTDEGDTASIGIHASSWARTIDEYSDIALTN